ncbi:MAG: hypothetical protein KatS3mg013_0040 [Actinomycetota bacterium]|nr:MAG: hypothetical protein KatS3mg013_0040 [Actinomycetota bacterium]
MRSLALLGSGEFADWTAEVDAWLLERADGDGRVLICPTASAPEGEAVFRAWGDRGLEHFAEAGIRAEVLDLRTRRDAQRPEILEAIATASVLYVSGGNPWYFAQTLRGTAAWRAIVERLDRGLAYAGCSAGVACLTHRTYDTSAVETERIFRPGLGLARPGVVFAPHWDVVERWVPGARAMIAGSVEPGGVLVAIDEETALLGDGRRWRVVGRQGVHVLREGAWTHLAPGDRLEVELVPLLPSVER